MEVQRLWALAIEGFRSVNKLNPVYMQSLFEKNINSKRCKDNLKGALSGLRQFLAIESPLKMMKNAFYSTSKALFVLKIFKFSF